MAKDRYGALSALSYKIGDPGLGRYDTVGRTLYFADSRKCAYAEVLTGFRQERGALAADAASAGYELDDWIDLVTDEALANDVDTPWAISLDWQFARSIYAIDLPPAGWWVQIDHPETLIALIDAHPHRHIQDNPVLTLADLSGEDRHLTQTLAQHIRDLVLDDGSQALGISFPSKTTYGRCWAFWDRRVDLNLASGRDDPRQVNSQNVGPDPAFLEVAGDFRLQILPARP